MFNQQQYLANAIQASLTPHQFGDAWEKPFALHDGWGGEEWRVKINGHEVCEMTSEVEAEAFFARAVKAHGLADASEIAQ